MDFDLSEEQRLLKDSIDRLLASRYADLKARAGYMAEPKGYRSSIWQEIADLGLLGIPFAEAHGGLGQSFVEIMIVMEAIGRNLALEPYLPTVVLAGGCLRHAGREAQIAALAPDIIAGKTTLALAHLEKQARYDLADTATTARSDGKGGYVIEGEKCVVLGGDSADKLVVSARTSGDRRSPHGIGLFLVDSGASGVSGDRRSPHGIGLFLVDSGASGVSRRAYPTQDGLRAADIAFAGVRVGPEGVLGDPGAGYPILARVVDEAIAALAAESVGAMEGAHLLTVEYLKTRKQFGVPIGSFQVLQHRSVDMFTNLEQSRSMAYYATMMAAEPDPAERARAMSAVKVQIGRSGRFIGQEATQLHGGIGMTMEYKSGHYFKRLTMIDLAFGPADHHLKMLATGGGVLSEAA